MVTNDNGIIWFGKVDGRNRGLAVDFSAVEVPERHLDDIVELEGFSILHNEVAHLLDGNHVEFSIQSTKKESFFIWRYLKACDLSEQITVGKSDLSLVAFIIIYQDSKLVLKAHENHFISSC